MFTRMGKKYVFQTLDNIEIITVQYKYYICDVFTTKRFGGNPLAVLPDAEGLTAKQIQQIRNNSCETMVNSIEPAKLTF